LLNGGFQAWEQAGYADESGLAPRFPQAWFGRDEPLHPEYLVATDYIREVVNGEHPDAVIADIRTWDEYIGASAPYDYIPTDGRIKGALWGHAGAGPWTMEDFVDADGSLRSYTEVAAMWAAAGITADKNVSHYCGTGWRAALTFFYGYMMGWERVNLYDGGWYEWSMGADAAENPIIDETPGLPIYE
ncbi:MAG: rhodanese, partial [Deltaproteobacteria bacterium]|nr:rhodanese [Deltaproteobacteria bacterium]